MCVCVCVCVCVCARERERERERGCRVCMHVRFFSPPMYEVKCSDYTSTQREREREREGAS